MSFGRWVERRKTVLAWQIQDAFGNAPKWVRELVESRQILVADRIMLTKTGWVSYIPGNMMVKEDDGSLWIVTEEKFHKTYEPV